MNLLCLDTETDGVDPHNDHIVTLTMLLVNDQLEVLQQADWLVDFGGEIPEGASDVHGISTERMRAEGIKGDAIAEMLRTAIAIIRQETAAGAPLALYNAAFDLTLLLTEARRHLPAIEAEEFEVALRSVSVLDPLVIWKHVEKYRSGKRTLSAAAEAFGIDIDETKTHDAAYDCWLTAQVAFAIMRKFPQVSTLTSPPNINAAELHQAQVGWRAEQQASLQAYFRSAKAGDRRDPNAVVDGAWPIQTEPAKELAA